MPILSVKNVGFYLVKNPYFFNLTNVKADNNSISYYHYSMRLGRLIFTVLNHLQINKIIKRESGEIDVRTIPKFVKAT